MKKTISLLEFAKTRRGRPCQVCQLPQAIKDELDVARAEVGVGGRTVVAWLEKKRINGVTRAQVERHFTSCGHGAKRKP